MKFEEEFPSLPKARLGTVYIGYTVTQIKEHCVDKQKVREALHGAILSMSKYKEGKIKEALNEYIEILYKELGLE